MTTRQTIFWTLCVCLLYLATAKLGLEYAVIGQTVTLLWPPSGIALAAVMIGGYHMWLGVALGAFIANAWTGIPPITLAMITLGNTLEPLCAAVLLKRRNDFSAALDKVSDVTALLLAAAGSTVVAASIGTLGLFAGGEIAADDFALTGIVWWLGDGLGVLIISPLLLTAYARLHNPATAPSRKITEALLLTVALTLAGQAIFGSSKLAHLGYYPVALSLFPFAIWSGLRFGPFGAAAVALLVSFLAVRGTVQGTGPFVMGSVMGSLVRWCLFADMMAATGLFLAAVSSEREKALAELKASNENLEKQIQKRTDDLIQSNWKLHSALAERQRLQMEMDQIGEERQKMIGQELHDGLGQRLIGIAFLVSALHAELEAKSAPEASAVKQVENLLADALSSIRSLSRGLYPVALECGGFVSALHHLAEYAQSFSTARCTVHCTLGGQAIDKDIKLHLYRIAQEAVCNAMRHGKAQCIDIKLSGLNGKYRLAVEDDGIGFSDQTKTPKATLGLRSMRCRADLIGAAIEVHSTPGDGTSVIITGTIKRPA